jgi:hypothetical protein
MPSVTQLPNTKPIEPPKPKGDDNEEEADDTNGSDGGGPNDPLIRALIQKLPRRDCGLLQSELLG